MPRKREGKVLVIGAGLGGLSAAISLATDGFDVEVFEKNDRIGGKLNLLQKGGYSFDLGPSLFILPHIYRRLFERAGRRLEDYCEFVRLEPQWRSFFEDGVTIDLHGDTAAMEAELSRLGADPGAWWSYVDYSRRLFKFAEESYLEPGSDSIADVLRGRTPGEVLRGTDLLRTMQDGVDEYLREPHLRDMAAFFIKYVGSSSFAAPATMNLLPYSQLGWGLWYVRGGMYGYARACGRLMDELGVKVRLGAEVARIERSGRRVTGVTLADGVTVGGDFVVSNMEVVPAYERLLGEKGLFLKKYKYLYEPACSGLVLDFGLDCVYPQLAHHNFFFSSCPRRHFEQVHRLHELPDDPTLYVVCATATDPSVAPPGGSVVKVLPHIPYVQEPPFSENAYVALRERVIAKLERMGLRDFRRHVVVADELRPEDLQRMYYSNRGAIYGVVADRNRNFGLKAPKTSERYENLYFVGGSVNPGGGTPMVLLSGQAVARRIRDRAFER